MGPARGWNRPRPRTPSLRVRAGSKSKTEPALYPREERPRASPRFVNTSLPKSGSDVLREGRREGRPSLPPAKITPASKTRRFEKKNRTCALREGRRRGQANTRRFERQNRTCALREGRQEVRRIASSMALAVY
jgi:hypothetical protein